GDREAKRRSGRSPGRSSRAHAAWRARLGDPAAGTTGAAGTRRLAKIRDRKMVAHHQGRQYQGRVSEADDDARTDASLGAIRRRTDIRQYPGARARPMQGPAA